MGLLLSNPPAIIIVNNDLSASIKNTLIKQLRIDQVLDGYTFDQYLEANPNWADEIRDIHNQRILVIRDLRELQNRQYADIVAFVSHGLISTEYNKFGPPVCQMQVRNIHWGQLCVWVKQKGPGEIGNACGCNCGCGCGSKTTCYTTYRPKTGCQCLVPIPGTGSRVRGV